MALGNSEQNTPLEEVFKLYTSEADVVEFKREFAKVVQFVVEICARHLLMGPPIRMLMV